MSSADGSAKLFRPLNCRTCRPLPTIIMFVRAYSPPLSNVDFFMAIAVCCKLCLYQIHSATT